jgi:hypothetical protein
VLSEDDAGEAVLPSVDLASSFPWCCGARAGWPGRFAAFVSRNAAALGQLRHLDLGNEYIGTARPITSTVLAALAQLPSLQSLRATVDKDMEPRCWSLGSLKQLTGLRLCIKSSGARTCSTLWTRRPSCRSSGSIRNASAPRSSWCASLDCAATAAWSCG